MNKLKVILPFVLALLISSYASARDQIKVVGSSTVYPYATVVAEKFGKDGKFKTPVIESTGTGGGMKLFALVLVLNIQILPMHHELSKAVKKQFVQKMELKTL